MKFIILIIIDCSLLSNKTVNLRCEFFLSGGGDESRTRVRKSSTFRQATYLVGAKYSNRPAPTRQEGFLPVNLSVFTPIKR